MFWKAVVLFLVGLTARSATLTAISGQTSYLVGDHVLVDFTILNVADLYAFQFDVSFDPAILLAQSVTESGYFLSNGVSFSPGTIDNSAGNIRFIADALGGSSPTLNGSTALVFVTFTAVGSGTTNVVPTNLILLDSHLSDISASAVGTPIQVSGTNLPEASSYELIGVGLMLLIAARHVKLHLRKHS